MKKVLSFMMYFCLIAGIMSGCGHEHSWVEATCTEPETCIECGETEGDALGHTWVEATCTEPKTCIECGETEGDTLGHTWVEATCTEPKTCSVCGETEGGAIGHTWVEATCTEPKTCSVCGEIEGNALGHTWIDATCVNPKTCSVCGEIEGDIGDHTWIEATCLMPKVCSVCGTTEGETGTHNYNENGICVVCGQSREIELTVDNVNDYLAVSFEITDVYSEYEYQHGLQTYGEITYKIIPKTDEFIFQDVYVCASPNLNSTLSRLIEIHTYLHSHEPQIPVDSSGCSSENTWWTQLIDRGGNKLETVYIVHVSGTCIRK